MDKTVPCETRVRVNARIEFAIQLDVVHEIDEA